MALDTLAAIGLASNILQFIEFGHRILSESREIFHSATGSTAEHSDLESVTATLSQLCAGLTLELGQDVIETMASVEDEEVGIATVALSAKAIADELLSTLQRLKRTNNGKHRRWASLRQALEGMWNKDKIEQLKTRLADMRAQLSVQLLAFVSRQQRNTLDRLKRLYPLGNSLKNSIQSLEDKLSECMLAVPFDKAFFEDTARKIATGQLMKRRHEILSSLAYEHMDSRQNTIMEAHHRTFEWMFSPENWGEHDPRSKIQFRHWLEEGEGVYWIAGKPGSGKSTLMKYLHQHQNTRKYLSVWAGGGPLATPAFYFWISGLDMQRSLLGLLRQLLFGILADFPDLIETVLPIQFIEGPPIGGWTKQQLLDCFVLLSQAMNPSDGPSHKACLFIDGLDEFKGDPLEIIEILEMISKLPGIKICASSRPWNYFEDAFGKDARRKLYLQDLTTDDIATYAYDRLAAVHGHQPPSVYGYHRAIFSSLVADIIKKAQGVFLWVYFVVRSLREGLVNGDGPALLQQRLDEFPSDLEEFFKRLLESVDKVYRKSMGATFQIALRAPNPLRLIHYMFLEEEDAITFQHRIPPSDSLPWYHELNSVLYHQETAMCRRLNGRYKGLLEAVNFPKSRTVHFIHRTIRDFLLGDNIQNLLMEYTGSSFSVNTHACKALVAQAKALPGSLTAKDIQLFMFWARNQEIEYGGNDPQIMDDMNQSYHILQPAGIKSLDMLSFLGKVIKSGLSSYIDHLLRRDPTFVQRDCGAALYLALFPDLSDIPYPNMVPETSERVLRLLLNHGVSPSQPVEETYPNRTVFHKFVCTRLATPIEHYTPLAICIFEQSLSLLMSYGAQLDQVFSGDNCWFSLAIGHLDRHRPAQYPGSYRDYDFGITGCLRIFFDYGFNPNIPGYYAATGRSIWETLLAAVLASQTNHGTAEYLCMTLLKAFLDGGADPQAELEITADDDVRVEVKSGTLGGRYTVRWIVENVFDGEARVELGETLRLAIQRRSVSTSLIKKSQQPRRNINPAAPPQSKTWSPRKKAKEHQRNRGTRPVRRHWRQLKTRYFKQTT